MDLKYLYTSPRGRISRKTWWLGFIGLIVIVFLVQLVLSVIAAALGISSSSFALGLMSLISTAILFLPFYALTVKRLHDCARPTALFWAFSAPSIIAALLMMLGVSGDMRTTEVLGRETLHFVPNLIGLAIGVISLVVGIWALVELGLMIGQPGDNAYGPDPLGRARGTVKSRRWSYSGAALYGAIVGALTPLLRLVLGDAIPGNMLWAIGYWLGSIGAAALVFVAVAALRNMLAVRISK